MSALRIIRAVQRPAVSQSTVRCFATKKGDLGPNKTHTTDKPPYDVQSTPSNQARANKGNNDNSGAVEQKDPHNSNERADQETKAPKGTVIGMNDERGGKGL